DQSFNPGANGYVSSIALLPDDRILVGGGFTVIGGQAQSRIALLSSNGVVDTSFAASADATVICMAVQPDGKIVVGGDFTNLCGVPRSRIGRLNPDGTLDESFNPVVNNTVQSIALQANGKIVLGGFFTEVNGVPRGYLARLDSSGTLDAELIADANGAVYSTGIQLDGKILVGGTFSQLDGEPRSAFGRLNNSDPAIDELTVDGSTIIRNWGGSKPQFARTTFLVSTNGDGWINLGRGNFEEGAWKVTSKDSLPPNSSVRILGTVVYGARNSSSWTFESFHGPPVFTTQPASRTNNPGTLATFNAHAEGSGPISYQWLKDGTPLVNGGNISGSTSQTLNLGNVFGIDAGDYCLVASNSGGSVTSLVARLIVNDPLIVQNPTNQAVQTGQTLSFSVTASGSGLNYQWRKDGVNLSGRTTASFTISNSQVSDAGYYDVVVSNAFGEVISTKAAVTVNGATPDSFNPNASGSVYAIAFQSDWQSVVGGNFGTIGGQFRSRIARLSQTGVSDINFSPSADLPVFTLAIQEDGKILVGGFFRNLNTHTRSYFGRLHPDGSIDHTFSPNPTNGATFPGVYSTILQPDGKILVAGDFRTIAGASRTNIARLLPDGSLDASFESAVNDIVYPVALQPDGRILLAGNFTSLGGEPRLGIGRLNADGTIDHSFDSAVRGLAVALLVQPDGKILVSGAFTNLAGISCTNIGRLNPDGSFDHSFTSAANVIVRSLALQANGKVVVGGEFTTLGGLPRNSIGRLHPDGSIDLTFNPGVTGPVFAVAIQPDGKILVAGETFTTVGGVTRNRIARLNNPDVAVDHLSFDGSTIEWTRGGSTPEVWRSTFDVSTNGTSWVRVGEGEKTGNGWRVSGLNLPAGTSVRARGFATGGRYSGSTWFHETLIGPPVAYAPMILSDPQGGTYPAGSSMVLGVEASGTQPLSFTWMRNGINLQNSPSVIGANKAVLTATNLLGSTAGSYSVRVSNAVGVVTSAVAMVKVIDPFITHQPLSKSLNAGNTATFSVGANGSSLGFQWFRDETLLTNATRISGATSSNLTISALSGADQAEYKVVVSGTYGAVTSWVATLNVQDPVINTHPISRSVYAGDNVTFGVSATGTDLAFAWRKNGALISGQFASSLNLTNVSAFDRGDYDVVVTSSFGSITSSVAQLSVNAILADSFDPGANGSVHVATPYGNGKILVGGVFSSIAGQQRNFLAVLNSDGSADTNFNANLAGSFVSSLAVQGDGKIIVGGIFNASGNGQSRTNLARFNSDGSLDISFNAYSSGSVNAIALEQDGNILIGGSFTNISGLLRHRMARLHPDGTVDELFVPMFDWDVETIAIQPDGRILVGGLFSTVSGESRGRLARLEVDGTLDQTFSPTSNDAVRCLAVRPDGKIVVGGRFSSLNGKPKRAIGRLMESGELDESFHATPISHSGNFFSWVNTLVLQADGKLLIGGSFSWIN
ncbi:MAG: immunoglobulin domain-containing protein, partial [Limisphaerales bacterium]